MEIINLQNVRKVFDNNEVIKNCNMSVKKGSIYGFLGRNGAGKTTVLKLIAGLLQPTSGTIKVFGMSMLTDRNKILTINEQIQNIAQKKDTLCRRMYN